MARRVIIFTPYVISDTARAAIRVAELCQQLGAKVLLVAVSHAIDKIDPYWDCHIRGDREQIVYLPDDLFVFMAQPDESWGAWLAVNDLPYVIVYNTGFDFEEMSKGIYSCAVKIVCPDKYAMQLVKSEVVPIVGQLSSIPWDIGGSIYGTQVPISESIVMLPMHDMHWQSVHPCYIDHLASLAAAGKYHLVIAASPRWPPALRKLVKQVSQRWPRASSVLVRDEMHIRELFSAASLVVWPGTQDPFGSVTQLGLYAGVPVLTWRAGMAKELIQQGSNGVLVTPEYDDIVKNHRHFLATVTQTIAAPSKLRAMRDRTHSTLSSRQRAFVKGWQEIVEIRR